MSAKDREIMVRSSYREKNARTRFAFLQFPETLQDQIISELDGGKVTFAKAAKIASAAGFPISGESIRRYYQNLIAERRADDCRNAWLRAADTVREMDVGKVIETFLCYMLGLIMSASERGEIDLPVKDVLKLLSDVPTMLQRLMPPPQDPQPSGEIEVRIGVAKKAALKEVFGNVIPKSS